jgi:hypothetical protein
VKAAWCAVGVATDAAVAHVHFQREDRGGNRDGELHAFAVACCGQRLGFGGHDEFTRDE